MVTGGSSMVTTLRSGTLLVARSCTVVVTEAEIADLETALPPRSVSAKMEMKRMLLSQ
jgi:hypothetical protein